MVRALRREELREGDAGRGHEGLFSCADEAGEDAFFDTLERLGWCAGA
jgi:hypothetical protein